MKSKSVDMLNCNLSSGIVKFTIPIIITNVLTLLFNAADLMVVGNLCGSKTVAAVGATSSLVALMVNFFLGLASGSSVVVSQLLGEGDEKKVSRAVNTAMPLSIVSGVLVTLIGVVFSRNFLQMMGTPKDIIDMSVLYLKIYFAGVTLRLVYLFSAAILRAGGDTKTPMKYLTLGGILNVIFNIFFVTVLHMTVDGVAWGTVISEGVSAVLCLRTLIKRTDCVKFSFKKISFDLLVIKRIFQIGVPAGLQSCLFQIANVLVQSSVNSFGSTVIAGNSAAVNIGGFVSTAAGAFQNTSANFMGISIGAKKYKRAKKIPWTVAMWNVIFSLTLGGLAFAFSRRLLGLYITDNPAAVTVGVKRLFIVTFMFFLCSIMESYTGSLRGMGKSFVPMLITLLGSCGIRVLWVTTVVAMPAYHKIELLYIIYPISWIITSIGEIIAYKIIWKNTVERNNPKPVKSKEKVLQQ